jgi:hypothetical protein
MVRPMLIMSMKISSDTIGNRILDLLHGSNKQEIFTNQSADVIVSRFHAFLEQIICYTLQSKFWSNDSNKATERVVLILFSSV